MLCHVTGSDLQLPVQAMKKIQAFDAACGDNPSHVIMGHCKNTLDLCAATIFEARIVTGSRVTGIQRTKLLAKAASDFAYETMKSPVDFIFPALYDIAKGIASGGSIVAAASSAAAASTAASSGSAASAARPAKRTKR
jgi:hypothetical protein